MKDLSETNRELLKEISALKKEIHELDRANKELRFSREQQRLLIDSGPDFFFLKDLDLRYQLVNSANARFFGRHEADILGRTDKELMSGEAAIACQESDRLAIREKRMVVTNETVGDRFYETRKFPVIVAAEVVGVAGIVHDITDHKRAEEALSESEAKYRTLVEDSLAGVYIYQDDLLRFVNRRFCEICGYSREEIVDTLSPRDIIHPDDRHLLDELYGKSPAGEPEDMRITARTVRKDGTTIVVNVLGRLLTYGGRPASIGTVYDTTEQEEAQEQLRQKTALLEAQVNASLDGIIVTDRGRKILQNRQMIDLLKIPPHIYENDDDGAQLEWVRGLVKNLETFDAKTAYLNAHPAGEIRDELELKEGAVLDVFSKPVIGRDGKSYGRLWTFRDITEGRHLAEERENLILDLREALKKVKLLSGLLPVCASCKRIRNDQGYWEQIEVYIRDHSEVEFSHGICPECAQKLYPEYFEDK